MPRVKKRNMKTVEWDRKSDNIGVSSTSPDLIIHEYLKGKNINKIIEGLLLENIDETNHLDICVLSLFWWQNLKVKAARASWFSHPVHHSSELFFDLENKRIKIVIRQPDLNGEHWKGGPHIHIVRGQIDEKDKCNILNVDFDKHVKFTIPNIYPFKYIIKVK